MIDVFLRTNTPIRDIRKALGGFDCNRVCVRNGGPTEIWQRTAHGWERDVPGMTLFEDFRPDYIGLDAHRREGVVSRPVGDAKPLRMDRTEAQDWLAAMEPNRYALEDAIGCTVGVEHEGKAIVCAWAFIPMSEFKSMTMPTTPLAQKILAWADRALKAGADEISATIAIAGHR